MIDPRDIVERWSKQISESCDHLLTLEVRVAVPPDVNDKAGVIVRRSPVIGSATVWRNGCVEWIAIDESSGDILRNADQEFASEAEILSWITESFSETFKFTE